MFVSGAKLYSHIVSGQLMEIHTRKICKVNFEMDEGDILQDVRAVVKQEDKFILECGPYDGRSPLTAGEIAHELNVIGSRQVFARHVMFPDRLCPVTCIEDSEFVPTTFLLFAVQVD